MSRHNIVARLNSGMSDGGILALQTSGWTVGGVAVTYTGTQINAGLAAAIAGAGTAAATGTTNDTFTVNLSSGYPRFVFSCPDSGTGNYAITFSPPTTMAGNRAVTWKDAAGEVTLNEGVQTLTNKTLGATTMSGTLTTLAITAAAGAYAIDFSASTSTFGTPTGAATLNGDTSLAANIGFSCATGTSSLDMVSGTGIFRTTTGENTLSGNVTISGSKTFTTGSGAVTLAGNVTISGTKTFSTGTGTVTINGATSITAVGLTWTGAVANALIIPKTLTAHALRVGDWVGLGASGSAVTFAAGQNVYSDGQLDLVAVFGESTSDLTSAYSAKCGRFRHLVNGITCNHETYGLVGQIAAKTVTFAHLHGGLMGTFEINTAATVSAGDGFGCAGVISRVGGATITVGATGVLAGFLSTQNATTVSITSGGVHAAFACRKTGSGVTWAEALHIEDALVAIRFKAADNSYAHSIKAATSTIATATSHTIKVMIGTTAGYIPVFANETCAE